MIIAASQHESVTDSASYLDSLKKDTTKTDTGTSAQSNDLKKDSTATGDNPANSAVLKQLASIDIDAPTFKKLYAKARKKYDKFSGNTYIHDKSSPQYVNYNGIYAYIAQNGSDFSLRFSIQYAADDWLFIKKVTFNADGENYTYTPDFKTDNGDGGIWEWCDDEVYGTDIAMLADIANAKKAQARYDGDKYYKVVNITPMQRAALKKQLQIYKGLLLGYNKTK
ncbi:hypothetical protein [Mucilaginibacter celer]|uniref:Uncharacterized protein n=1 Tax=Mucilaginibacter celer TaxID=2305508 RepID=A0A494VWF9_9SPHI|nr:hypothetical protein [Mucilaginibacter celer]AYL95803.1 hypothetical protein HYN43_011115 [Mucilaginibacter celer]